MKIKFHQSGGVVGAVRPPKVIDTDAMPAAEAARWHGLVAAADFFQIPATPPPSPRRDAFSCVVTVEDGGRAHTVQTDYRAGDSPLDRLLEQLRRASP